MRLSLLAVGTRLPDWVNAGYQDYARRLPRECALQLKEIGVSPRRRGTPVAEAIKKEGERMLAAIPPRAWTVALDVGGKPWTTEDLASRLDEWMAAGDDVALLVGGPDGLAPACLDAARVRWSLTAMTLPHGLVRVVVAEQIYRAWSFLRGHPYHRP